MFKIKEVEDFYDTAILPRFGEAQRADIDKELNRLRTSSRRLANKHLLPWIVLIDEGIHFLFFLERLIPSIEEKRKDQFTLKSLISKLRSLAISFRELIILGQSDSSRLILRGFLETSDLTLVAMSDPEFCDKYSPDPIPSDNYDNAFWKSNIAYGKIYKLVSHSMEKAGYEKEQITDLINRKKSAKTGLSGAVHTDASSALQVCLIPSLIEPGQFVYNSLGHLSAYSPSLCNYLIEELLILSGTFQGLINTSKMPSHLKGISTSTEYANTLSSCETIHEYYYKFFDDLHIPFDELFPDE